MGSRCPTPERLCRKAARDNVLQQCAVERWQECKEAELQDYGQRVVGMLGLLRRTAEAPQMLNAMPVGRCARKACAERGLPLQYIPAIEAVLKGEAVSFRQQTAPTHARLLA